MRKLLMIASVAAMAVSMPAAAKERGDRGDRDTKSEQRAERGDRERGDRRVSRENRQERRAEAREHRARDRGERRAERRSEHVQRIRSDHRRERDRARAEVRRDRNWDRRERREERYAKENRKQERRFARQERKEDRRYFAALHDQQRQRARAERRFEQQDRRYRQAEHRAERRFWSEVQRRRDYAPRVARQSFFNVGQIVPAAYYADYNVPARYQDVYYDNPDTYYRYDNGNILGIDSGSNLISSLIPLLGGAFGVGQLMPAGYDAYNLPMQYRDTYYDTPETSYRYGDGGIFQVDSQTGMIESIVALLAGDLNVGQLLPSGYDAYNLPLEYRDQYADNDEHLYRYNDGNIYEVDARSMMIENVISALI